MTTAVIELGADDTADNPASTKPERRIVGPATVVYRRYGDGGIDAAVTYRSR